MTRAAKTPWALLAAGNVAAWCMLGLYQPTSAAPQPAPQPFANAVEQRAETNTLLRELVAEMKAQNALLRSGTLQVNLVDPKKRP